MSDLHKQFLNKIKQQEQAFGLSPLNEDEENVSIESLSKLGPSFGPKSSGIGPPGSKSTSMARNELNHYSIEKDYQKEITNTFEIHKFNINDISFQTYFIANGNSPLFIFNHGAGSSSMTFCKLAQQLKDSGILLYDMRGHGKTSGGILDFSLKTLTQDFGNLLVEIDKLYDIKSRQIYLVGHSLGGAILTNYLQNNPDTEFNIRGLVMLDIVEETAVSSLNAMHGFITKIPPSFTTYQQAIDWHVKVTHLLRNTNSAAISVPDLLLDNGSNLIWRTNLYDTQQYWDTWFSHLSANFVKCGHQVSKLLLLAGHETLDKDLMIGQMQGKYQLIVFNNSNAGHFLQEDIPDKVAVSLIDFVKRGDPDEYMRRELGFVPKWGGKVHK